jgi:hypothetical protein
MPDDDFAAIEDSGYSPLAQPLHFCGVTALFGDGTAQVKLPSSLVTFRVDSDLPGISRADFEAACMVAWRRWAKVIKITVDKHANPKTTPTQIVNGVRLDRRGGVLAQQELPFGSGIGLNMQVDTLEPWSLEDEPQQAMSLPGVLCHEDGHCLGMQHIEPEGDPDLMNAIYRNGIFQPQPDDVVYGRKLYGGPLATPDVPNTPSTPSGAVIEVNFTVDGIKYRAAGTAKRVA